MQVQDVEVTKIVAGLDHELSDTLFRVCVFCDKMVKITPSNFKSCIRLSNGVFHCPFYLRHNHHHRSARNILVMSLRAIAAYYYYRFYLDNSEWDMYISDIDDILTDHVKIGLQNPVFVYDPNTMLWFIDFNRIGVELHKAPFDEVIDTISKMYDCFQVENHFSPYIRNDLWDKFNKAVTLFYQKRRRPKYRRFLIPTLANQAVQTEKDEFWDKTREFVRSHMNFR